MPTRSHSIYLVAFMTVLFMHMQRRAFADDSLSVMQLLSITPEAAVIAGLESVASIAANLESEPELRQVLSAQRATVEAAASQATTLWNNVLANPDDQQVETQYAAAIAGLQSAKSQLASTTEELFDTAVQGLTQAQVDRLVTWRTTQGRRVPPEFRVTSRSDEQWQAIEAALVAEKRAERLGEELDSDHDQVLGAVRAEFDVIAAANALQSGLLPMQADFEELEPAN